VACVPGVGQSAITGQGRVGQGSHGGQSCDWIIAQRGDGFPRRVTGALHGPFVVLLQEDGPSQACDGVFVRLEDADDLGSAFELAVQPLQGNHPVKLSITHKCKHSKFSAYLDVG